MPATHALSTDALGSPLTASTIERRALGPHDVAIDIRFCGICHSDINQVKNEWGNAKFPMVPGHEITGVVTATGSEVSRFSAGDRVGVGCMVDSCGECEFCLESEEQFCTKPSVQTYNDRGYDGELTFGGYSGQIVVSDRFVLSIPDSLELDEAAPLLCAGITTFSPLRHWNVGPGTKVAVVGMGGLGHVAVKLAAAMGAEVTVLSQSLSKQEDGLRFGAKDYYATSERSTFKELAARFDFILNTVSANLDLGAYLSLLRPNGVMVSVGVPTKPDMIHAFALIAGRRSLAGSPIGGIAQTQEMLDFCGEHGVAPQIELIGADDVNDAYGRVERSEVRYRFVIDVSTIGG